jgi:hypothetical protein
MYKNNPNYIGARGQRDKQNSQVPPPVNRPKSLFLHFFNPAYCFQTISVGVNALNR